MCLTSFGDDSAGPLALPHREDALVDKGLAAPKSCLSPVEMRTLTAAGDFLATGEASTTTRITFYQLSLRFCPTEETGSRTSNQYATDYNSFRKMKVVETNQGKLRCSILVALQIVCTPTCFWKRGTHCFMGRLTYGRRMVPKAGTFFGRRMTSEYHFPEKGTSDSHILRSIAVSPQPGWLKYVVKVR